MQRNGNTITRNWLIAGVVVLCVIAGGIVLFPRARTRTNNEITRDNVSSNVSKQSDVQQLSQESDRAAHSGSSSAVQATAIPGGDARSAANPDGADAGAQTGTAIANGSGLTHSTSSGAGSGLSANVELSVDRLPILAGGRADVLIRLKADAYIKQLDFALAYPGMEVTISAARAAVSTMTIQRTPGFGKAAFHVEFAEPYRSEDDKLIVTVQAQASRKAALGAIMPLRLTDATARLDGDSTAQVETFDGFLQVVDDLSKPFAPPAFTPGPIGTVTPFPGTATPGPTGTPTPFISPTPTLTPDEVRELSIMSRAGKAGEIVLVPVMLSEVRDLQGIQFEVIYDPGQLLFMPAKSNSAMAPKFFESNAKSGRGIVVMICGNVGSGQKTVCDLKFKVLAKAQPGRVVTLDFSSSLIAAKDLRIEARTHSGTFTILGPNGAVPTWVPSPASTPQAGSTPGSSPMPTAPSGGQTPQPGITPQPGSTGIPDDQVIGTRATPTRSPGQVPVASPTPVGQGNNLTPREGPSGSIETPTPTATATPTMNPDRFDLNGDGKIDGDDILIFYKLWKEE